MFFGSFSFPPVQGPAGAIDYQYGACALRHPRADLAQVQAHRIGVGVWQNQRCADVARGTDRTEDIGPLIALVATRRRAASTLGPNVGQAALLANPRFILPPKFDRPLAGGLGKGLRNELGEVFLCASRAASSDLGL